MNEGISQNLNWFWKRWFYEDGVPDLAISGATVKKNSCSPTIRNVGGKPVPVDVIIFYSDNTFQTLHKPVNC